ncbi:MULTISPECIES: cell division protein ZapD [Alteromonadaceae]|jgi:cell division protein ZapD|uniref:Cell division protein ZapD n=1 Tax=Brumicola blandensis TaxID=3075611 RepID=A0AAW8R4D4_9ALTE|nr:MULTISPECIES: cell division protein ZapD [unclassified Alteromonas]MDT0583274.1 cell division protein ZapD [Alteromonas sp. W409]MDT0627580.1 cell division protein ZapD [Alteromonas sp. W364]
MPIAIYEFPLCEKVRNYLRLEQLFKQLDHTSEFDSEYESLYFFDVLFTLLDLLERLDIRTDFIRDIDVHEKNLVHWSKHPNIDSAALEQTLKKLHQLLSELKRTNKLGSSLKDDRFLASIRQRFSIPGGAMSFDLPHLFCWLKQAKAVREKDIHMWVQQLGLVRQNITLLMQFLRERNQYEQVVANNGFYQGVVTDKIDLIRLRCANSEGYYPVLSGNKYRYGIRFMHLVPEEGSSGSVSDNINFEIACC